MNYNEIRKSVAKDQRELLIVNEFLFSLVEKLTSKLLKVSSRRDKALSLAKNRDSVAKNLLETQFIADEEIRFLRGKVGELEKENSKLRLITRSSSMLVRDPVPDASTVAKAILARQIKKELIIRSPQEKEKEEKKEEKREWKRKRCPESVYMDFWDERTEINYQDFFLQCSQNEGHLGMCWGVFEGIEGRFNWDKDNYSSTVAPDGIKMFSVKRITSWTVLPGIIK